MRVDTSGLSRACGDLSPPVPYLPWQAYSKPTPASNPRRLVAQAPESTCLPHPPGLVLSRLASDQTTAREQCIRPGARERLLGVVSPPHSTLDATWPRWRRILPLYRSPSAIDACSAGQQKPISALKLIFFSSVISHCPDCALAISCIVSL